jgi:crossover junction endodeoxyribonuclease RuvC
VPATSRILGIDPGSRVTGYGVIDSDGRRSVRVASGVIRTAGAGDGDLAGRLRAIFDGLRAIAAEQRPQVVAIERVFMHRNADSALKLGQARAAAICATFALDLPVHEYAARSVKQAIVGSGAAEKGQVAHMVGVLLGHREALLEDEADALAIALCHAHTTPLAAALESRPRAALAGLRLGRGGRR